MADAQLGLDGQPLPLAHRDAGSQLGGGNEVGLGDIHPEVQSTPSPLRSSLPRPLQGRYKAIPIEDGEYLLRVSDYIHLNPARAGLLDTERPRLETYPWSSYPTWIKSKKLPSWSPMNQVMDWCGRKKSETPAYRRRMQGLVKATLKGELGWEDVKQGWVLGEEAFVQEMLEKAGTWMKERGQMQSYQGEEVHRHDEVQAGELLKQGLAQLKLTRSQLPQLAKTDVRKKALAFWIRSQTMVSSEWLAREIHMGHRVNTATTPTKPEIKQWIKTLQSTD